MTTCVRTPTRSRLSASRAIVSRPDSLRPSHSCQRRRPRGVAEQTAATSPELRRCRFRVESSATTAERVSTHRMRRSRARAGGSTGYPGSSASDRCAQMSARGETREPRGIRTCSRGSGIVQTPIAASAEMQASAPPARTARVTASGASEVAYHPRRRRLMAPASVARSMLSAEIPVARNVPRDAIPPASRTARSTSTRSGSTGGAEAAACARRCVEKGARAQR